MTATDNTTVATTTVVFHPMRWAEDGLHPIGTREPVRWDVPTEDAEKLDRLNMIPDQMNRMSAQAEVLRTPSVAAPEFVVGFSYDHAFAIQVLD